jgi:hypothetical protein
MMALTSVSTEVSFDFRSFSANSEMRQLKHHEQRLLKKVDFLQWKTDQTLQEVKVMRRYHVQNRDDYAKSVQYQFHSR